MATKVPSDPILKRFRAAVTEIYGDRVARVVLFGSRARGDAQPDSDYDVAVFLRDMADRFAEMN
ncbi:MAG: nucleotidyltransferase domain-containing protein, partial [Methylocella sp.]